MTPWVQRLLIANVVVFGVQVLAPALVEPLVFVPQAILTRPWSIVTYMFLHGGLGHLFFNMLGLFFFGARVEQRIGARDFAQLYFASGITGALLTFVLAPSHAVIGASAGVFGVMLAFALFWPKERIYIWGIIPVEAWLLVLITTALALYSGFGGSRGGVADFAHLGGYLGAWVYLQLRERFSSKRRFQQRMQQAPRVSERVVRMQPRDLRLEGVHALTRDEVNRILDKISAQGVGSLTPEERLFLSNFVPPDDRKSWVS